MENNLAAIDMIRGMGLFGHALLGAPSSVLLVSFDFIVVTLHC
jgi:hypothetical protein